MCYVNSSYELISGHSGAIQILHGCICFHYFDYLRELHWTLAPFQYRVVLWSFFILTRSVLLKDFKNTGIYFSDCASCFGLDIFYFHSTSITEGCIHICWLVGWFNWSQKDSFFSLFLAELLQSDVVLTFISLISWNFIPIGLSY